MPSFSLGTDVIARFWGIILPIRTWEQERRDQAEAAEAGEAARADGGDGRAGGRYARETTGARDTSSAAAEDAGHAARCEQEERWSRSI
jgi:hypothetical protein